MTPSPPIHRDGPPTAGGILAGRGARWMMGLAAAAMAVGVVAVALRLLADRHLELTAQREAVSWARHVAQSVPDLDLLLLGEPASAHAQERLAAMRGIAGLFRFKIFDREGQLLLISDSLGMRPAESGPNAADSLRALSVLSTGSAVINLQRGDGVHRPRLYSGVYVPITLQSQVAGVIEVYLDQTEIAADTMTSFRHATLVAGGMLTLVFLGATLLLRQRAVLENAARERARFLREHDALTGALNRPELARRLDLACQTRGEGKLAVLCVDIDAFAEVNERHGHAVGDELLRRVVARLQGVLRNADLLGRVGSDRFAVVQRDVVNAEAVQVLAHRLLARVGKAYRLRGLAQPLVISTTVGSALQGQDGDDAQALLQHAELALQRAKLDRRGGWAGYDAQTEAGLQARRALAQDLREAVADNRLSLHYQAVYARDGVSVLGVEALARWQHPSLGFVPPMRFIELAEETGQIVALGRWVLHSACQQAAAWPTPLWVAVNLSSRQFEDGPGLVREVGAALVDSGLTPERLELEITESLLLNDTEGVLQTLQSLKALGVRIAMDDFGTGYSSLSYLWRFPFDKLKIDRAFTQRLEVEDRVDAIVQSIITLAHSLALRVNAEGVETSAQLAQLQELGCDELQGYLLARPKPAEDVDLRTLSAKGS